MRGPIQTPQLFETLMRSRKHPMNKFLIIMIMTWGDMGEQSSKREKRLSGSKTREILMTDVSYRITYRA